ncbi:MAG: DUF1211 domain-containing protein [Methanosphaera stadtmanae]|jgi:uncharacterized membrane protein|nr:DUF1211 domain-containing protein [Methanosphaera stadtmanae]
MLVETERFEALIDAILAIIITMIVMEFPLPAQPTLGALIELYPDFIAYILSFMLCFSIWIYHHNLFNIVNRLNSTITWTCGVIMIFVGLLPHVTLMLSTNFYSFMPQAMFGLIFMITNIFTYIMEILIYNEDKANIALALAIENRKSVTITCFIIQIIGFIIGYLYYPPMILIACLLAIITKLSWKYIMNYI